MASIGAFVTCNFQSVKVTAALQQLKAAGIKVKGFKKVTQVEQAQTGSSFSFGCELNLLPHCVAPGFQATVPKFLVDTCEFLSMHLQTEGLFRKSGSISRIRELRTRLEQGEAALDVFLPMQACDVAVLLKQFIRELPSPLLPFYLQGPLCQAQDLQEPSQRENATLLLTTLLPQSSTCTLRYLCRFLQCVAERCDDNRMGVSSLAVVFSPTLFHFPKPGAQLSAETEQLLERLANVVQILITNAEYIGNIPATILSTPLDMAQRCTGAVMNEILPEYSVTKRRRRRSVGEIFVDAFSKLRTNRPPNGTPLEQDERPEFFLSQKETSDLQADLPLTNKRKASEETLPGIQFSAKKRRSGLNTNDDVQSDAESSPTEFHTPSLLSPESPEIRFETSLNTAAFSATKKTGSKRMQRNFSSRPNNSAAKGELSIQLRKSLRIFSLGIRARKQLTAAVPVTLEGQFKGTKATLTFGSPVKNQTMETQTTSESVSVSLDREDENTCPIIQNCMCHLVDLTDQEDSLPNQLDQHKSSTSVSHFENEVNKREDDMDWLAIDKKYCYLNKRTPRRSLSLPEGINEHVENGAVLPVSYKNSTDNLELDEPCTSQNVVCPSRKTKDCIPEVVITQAKVEEQNEEIEEVVSDDLDLCNSVPSSTSTWMSVADRIRRFNKLTSRLWSPSQSLASESRGSLFFQRAPVLKVAEKFEGGSKILKRRGARRFGRSLSHESAIGILNGFQRDEAYVEEHKEYNLSPLMSPPLHLAAPKIICEPHLFNNSSNNLNVGSPISIENMEVAEDLKSSPESDSALHFLVAGEQQRYKGSPKCPLSASRITPVSESVEL
ncbi:uncharacterized protein LOC120541369 isoform X1 [Polypterus senegalus]|uniref:uncharacterized protein LOC120541369 isoform X1 n=2 Tax=Polypterus senegalus TaxID=55291 RepID=UPI00196467DE|nr:uncharacterized protein LOC120541369 isoform X1 [Polypterus senegalus]